MDPSAVDPVSLIVALVIYLPDIILSSPTLGVSENLDCDPDSDFELDLEVPVAVLLPRCDDV